MNAGIWVFEVGLVGVWTLLMMAGSSVIVSLGETVDSEVRCGLQSDLEEGVVYKYKGGVRAIPTLGKAFTLKSAGKSPQFCRRGECVILPKKKWILERSSHIMTVLAGLSLASQIKSRPAVEHSGNCAFGFSIGRRPVIC